MKQERYKQGDKDLIDRWEDRYTPEEFRLVMWAIIERYGTRVGKKDDPVQEVGKILDYVQRWFDVELRR